MESGQRPDGIESPALAKMVREPADRLGRLGVGAFLQVIGMKIVRGGRRGVFAGHGLGEVTGQRGPCAEYGAEAVQLQPILVPRCRRLVLVQQGEGRRLVLADGLHQVMGQVEKRLRAFRGKGGASEGLDLLAVRRRPAGDGRPEVRHHRRIQRQEHRPIQTDVIEQQRQMRVRSKPLPREDPTVRPEHLPVNLQALEQIPQLRFQRQQGILAFLIRTTAHLDLFALDPFAQGGHLFRVFAAQLFQQCR